MTPLFTKLNLGRHDRIVVLDAPQSFAHELAALQGVAVERSVGASVAFALAFVVRQAELDAASRALTRAAVGDAVLWMVYPKRSSKRYRCEFDRDSGWTVLHDAGYDSMRVVAVDEDWSALRFRKSAFIGR